MTVEPISKGRARKRRIQVPGLAVQRAHSGEN